MNITDVNNLKRFSPSRLPLLRQSWPVSALNSFEIERVRVEGCLREVHCVWNRLLERTKAEHSAAEVLRGVRGKRH